MIIDMNYWTKVLKRIVIFAITLIGIYLSFKLAIFYMPFLIAFLISLLLEPAIRFLMKKLKFTRKASSIIVMIVVIGAILGLLAWLISTIITEGSSLLENLSTYVSNTSYTVQRLINHDSLKKMNIPDNLTSAIEGSFNELIKTATDWITSFIKEIIEFFTSIPTIGICLAVTFLSLYFICTDKIYIIDQIEHHLPEAWVKKLYKHLRKIIKALGSYLKAEAVLVLVSFVISLIGLYIFKFAGMKVEYPLLYAIGIGFVDALPIFGSRSCNGSVGDNFWM